MRGLITHAPRKPPGPKPVARFTAVPLEDLKRIAAILAADIEDLKHKFMFSVNTCGLVDAHSRGYAKALNDLTNEIHKTIESYHHG